AHAAGVLELHVETGGIAETPHRSGHERKNLCVAQVAERRGGALGDRVGGVLLAPALVPVLEIDETLSGVLSRGAAASAARDEKIESDVGLLISIEIFLDLVAHLDRARLRRARGQAPLYLHPALILARNEPAGQTPEQ